MSPHPTQKPTPTPAQTGFLGLLVRLIWMLFGNAALALLAVHIAQVGSFSPVDVVFWAVVVVMVGVRYIDVTRFGGLTAEGEPATVRHWQRYTGYLLAASAGLYVLAHALAGIVLR
jgi:hypothetical protein